MERYTESSFSRRVWLYDVDVFDARESLHEAKGAKNRVLELWVRLLVWMEYLTDRIRRKSV